MKILAISILLLLLLSGCRSYREVSVPDVVTRVVHDTVSNTRELHDSVLEFRDRLVEKRGDTVLIRDSIYLRKLVWRHDSVFCHKVDSIPVVQKVQVVKQVRYIPPWCKWLAGIGILTILLLLLYIFIKIKPLF